MASASCALCSCVQAATIVSRVSRCVRRAASMAKRESWPRSGRCMTSQSACHWASVHTAVVFQKWRWTEIAVTLGLIFVVSLRQGWPMTFIAVRCPHCQSDHIVKRGKTARGTQRYLCQNTLCTKGSFLLDYCNRGCLPEVKQTIIDMSLNASGVRDTARSLHICPNTVLRELKKKEAVLESV